ncbi:MAG: serine/threonine-protein phosphatase [Anaerolineales bacterium]|nr:serine/threonine-protein phosphatase [Anaerolineales bacterium]
MEPLRNFLKRLFGSSDEPTPAVTPAVRPADPDATVPLPELAARPAPDSFKSRLPPPSGTRLTIGLGQHVGQVRPHNEDVLLVFTGELGGLEPMPNFGLFIVADGMGGHSLGERASGLAARTISYSVLHQVLPSLLADPQAEVERPLLTEVMESAMAAANRAVVSGVPEGGTTLTGALILGDQMVLCHVGDTRAYLLQDGHLEQLTRDHSLVQRLKELGQITDDEAAVHPQRSVLYRAVGQGDGLEVDVSSRRLAPGSILLICSDGLWSLVPDHLILELIHQSTSLQAACDALVQAANDAGGPDNISAVMIQMPG